MSDRQNPAADNIISLTQFRDTPASGALRMVEAYWSTLRTGAGIPTRSRVNPRDLGDALPHVFILECRNPGIARFRVAGSQVTQLAGIEVRGMPMTAFMRPPARAILSSAIDTCLARPAVIDAPIRARSLQHAPNLSGSMILLPLRCDLGHVSRILGAIVMREPIRSDAYRLDMSSYEARPVFGVAPVSAAAGCQMAEPPVRFDGAPRLKLVHSNEAV